MMRKKIIEKTKRKCYKCGGELRDASTVIAIGGNSFEVRALKCAKCGEEEFTEEEVRKIRIKAQQAGVWGQGIKIKRKLQKVGRATAVYIPADIQKQLMLKPRQEVTISVQDRKIIIEPVKTK
jgi:YgiT-type zinc finger domain-containing protein